MSSATLSHALVVEQSSQTTRPASAGDVPGFFPVPVTGGFVEARSVQIVRVLAGQQWVSGGDLILPIRVTVSVEAGGSLVIAHAETGIFGVGRDFPSSIEDFRAALVEHRDVLERAQPLSPDLEDQLSLLRRHLRAGSK